MPIRHVIAQGESVIGLSDRFGHFAPKIWDDAANAALKAKRTNMNALLPGDVVAIPDKLKKEVTKADKACHKFRRKGIPATLRLQLFDIEVPRASQDYKLIVDGTVITGVTDAQGVLEEFVDPAARNGRIIVGPDQFTVELSFGHMDPHDEIPGIQKRLNNLGFDCGEPTSELNSRTQAALRQFQSRFDLPITGRPDEATIQKLAAQHDNPAEFPPEDAAHSGTAD